MIALARPYQLECRVLDAVAVDDLRLLLELLAADAVPAIVLGHEEIVGVSPLNAREQRGHRVAMDEVALGIEAAVREAKGKLENG